MYCELYNKNCSAMFCRNKCLYDKPPNTKSVDVPLRVVIPKYIPYGLSCDKKTARKGVLSAKRLGIYRRDGNKCLKCGETDIKKLTLDHVLPKSLGGKGGYKNLQTLCRECNHEKGTAIIDYRKL